MVEALNKLPCTFLDIIKLFYITFTDYVLKKLKIYESMNRLYCNNYIKLFIATGYFNTAENCK